MHFSQCVLAPRPQAHVPRVPNGFQRVPRQCTFRNACWRLGHRRIYHRFRTGSNGFRGSALLKMRAGAWAPDTLTTGSERAPMDSEAVQFSRCVLGPSLHTQVLCLPDTFWLKLHSSLFASQTNFASTMSSESLEFWTSGRKGTLSRKSQAQVWALTHVSELRSLQLTQEEIAGAVEKIGGGSPSQRAISDRQATIREDNGRVHAPHQCRA